MPLHERGLSYDTLMRFEIGFSKTKSRIVIPVRNQQYKVVGLIGRAIESSQEPRYLYNKGFKRADVLFNIQNAKNYSEVIVVEGSVDAMKVHEAGFPNVVATLGAQVSKNQITLMKKYVSINFVTYYCCYSISRRRNTIMSVTVPHLSYISYIS